MPARPTGKMPVLRTASIPKRVKIKPIVRREPGIMFQTIDVALRPMLDVFGAMLAIQNDFVGEFLEIDFVTVASSINPEEQDDRAMHHGCNHDGADRKRNGCAEKLTLHSLSITRRTIA